MCLGQNRRFPAKRAKQSSRTKKYRTASTDIQLLYYTGPYDRCFSITIRFSYLILAVLKHIIVVYKHNSQFI